MLITSFCATVLACTAAALGGESIRPGDTVKVTKGPAPVQVGEEIVATLKTGAEFQAIEVQDDWVGVTAEKDGKKITGWIDKRNLVLVAHDELALLKVEVATLRAKVKPQAEQIERLKAESRPFQDEIVGLRAELAKLREENDRLGNKMDEAGKAYGPGERKGVTFVPLVGDETSVAEILADSPKYLNKVVILCGGVTVKHHYYYGYRDAEGTHVSLGFRQVGADGRPLRISSSLSLYVKRDIAGPLVAVSTESIKAGFSGKVMRVSAVLLPSRVSARGDPQLEVLDWQIQEPDGTGWGPWAREAREKPLPKDRRKGP